MKNKMDHRLKKGLLQTIPLRQALRAGLAIFIAVAFYHFAHITQGYWIPMTALIIMQVTLGATLRKGLQRFLGTIAGILIATMILALIHQPIFIEIILVITIFLTFYLKIPRVVNYGIFVTGITIVIILFLTIIYPERSLTLAQARVYDTILGAVIGITVSLFVLPNRTDALFRQQLTEIYQRLLEYLEAITILLTEQSSVEDLVNKKRLTKLSLQVGQNTFPDWIYEKGFDHHLRKGYRFFLMKTERIAEILFSLHHIGRHPLHSEILLELKPYLQACSKRAHLALEAIIATLALNRPASGIPDFMVEQETLEKAYKSLTSSTVNPLSTNSEEILLAAMIYHFKYLNITLLQLAESLRV